MRGVIGDGGVRDALTALFAVLAAWYLGAAVRPLRGCGHDPRRQALGSGLHVLMSAAMISMFWSWGGGIPVIALVTVFTAAAGWFVGQAVFSESGSGTVTDAGGSYGAGPAVNWGHAGMMGAMVWMAVLMPLTSGFTGGGTSAAAGGAMVGMDMSSMDMSGQASTGTTVAAVTAAGSPGWTGTVCLVLAGALFALAAWRAVTALSLLAAPGSALAPGHRRLAGQAGGLGSLLSEGAVALMATGMAVALLEMA